jgi:hypothetical protein
MPIKLSDLLGKVPPHFKETVRSVRDRQRSVVQELLRSECRLVFRTAQEADENESGAQVPIEIAAGFPAVLATVRFEDDFRRTLLISKCRTDLEYLKRATPKAAALRAELTALVSNAVTAPLQVPSPDRWPLVSPDSLNESASWASALLAELSKNDPLKKVLEVHDDVLGVYQCFLGKGSAAEDDSSVNRAKIQLYWAVIGLVSQWSGWSVEDLAVVVMTHELAHAYTQLGADIEGRRWSVARFAEAEPALKEGLAQYYTHRVLERLSRRNPGPFGTFKQLLLLQPEQYRAHEPWLKAGSPEAVRRAMLEVRRHGETRSADFARRLEAAAGSLRSRPGSD